MAIVEKTFATISESTEINVDVVAWEDAEPEAQQAALEWSTVYMMDVYRIDSVSYIDVALVNANSLLAAKHLETDLFLTADVGKPEKGLTAKTVTADVASVSKSYDANISKQWSDPFPHITALLKCAGFPLKKSSGGMSTVSLMRR